MYDSSTCQFLAPETLTGRAALLPLFTRATRTRDGARGCWLAGPGGSAGVTARLGALGFFAALSGVRGWPHAVAPVGSHYSIRLSMVSCPL